MKGRSSPLLFLLASPILVLIGAAIIALCASTSPAEVINETHDPAVQDAIWLSLRTTLISLAIIVVCGLPLALLIQRKRTLISTGLEFLITLPAILPPSVAGIALLLAFGAKGVIGAYLLQWHIRLGFTTIAVVMAQTFVATPFFVREASDAFKSLQPSILDSARLDGAKPLQLFQKVMLPISAPFLLTGAILAWARALSEFGATILFAGSLQGVTQTLPIAIYIGFETNIEQAKAIAVILLVIAIATLSCIKLLFKRSMVYAH